MEAPWAVLPEETHGADTHQSPMFRIVWSMFKRLNFFQAVGLPYTCSLEWLLATCVSKTAEELRNNLTKQCEVQILVCSLLLSSAFGMVGGGIAAAEENEWLGLFSELSGIMCTFVCLTSTLINVFLLQTIGSIGEANLHVWLLTHFRILFIVNVTTVIAIFSFAQALTLYAAASSSMPYMCFVAVLGGWFFVAFISNLLLNCSGYSAVHSGMLSSCRTVIPIETIFALNDTEPIQRLVADKALASDGDVHAMINMYKRHGMQAWVNKGINKGITNDSATGFAPAPAGGAASQIGLEAPPAAAPAGTSRVGTMNAHEA